MPTRIPPSKARDAPDWPSRDALLEELHGGRDALDRAVTLLYGELREIAHRLRTARHHAALDTLGLVHETYLKLADGDRLRWYDRAQFLALAATVMRHVLTDRARASLAAKREGERIPIPVDSAPILMPERTVDVLEIVDALERLEHVDERLAHVVEYRFFGGLTNDEIGAALGVDERTVRRDWAKARSILRELLAP